MPPSTARAIRAAVSQILKIDDNWESVDVTRIDVDSLIARFRNLSKLAPGSLATYESRFRSGLESYLSYLNNPASMRGRYPLHPHQRGWLRRWCQGPREPQTLRQRNHAALRRYGPAAHRCRDGLIPEERARGIGCATAPV